MLINGKDYEIGPRACLSGADEGRPMETLWDVTTGLTAYARSIPFQDERISLEREAGKVLELVEV